MTRFRLSTIIAGMVLAAATSTPLRGQTTNASPDFQEVYDLVRSHLAGANDAELNRAAVEGFLEALGPRATLLTNGTALNGPTNTTLISRSNLFEGNLAYLRIASVSDGLARQFSQAFQRLGATNRIQGVVLDVRYAGGSDYATAAALAELFVAKAEPLLDWGNGMVSSQQKATAIRVPVAVLVNQETGRAAEALAAVLRQSGSGLILGSRTAGRAMVTREFPLKDGSRLQVATSPVRLGDGSPIPLEGVRPDIEVTVSPEAERAYFADEFLVLSKTDPIMTNRLTTASGETNLVSRRRFNEAELVREHREGLLRDRGDLESAPARRAEQMPPTVNDPALARALDLLKGLAVVRADRF